MRNWPNLHRIAREESARLLDELPQPVRARVMSIPLMFQRRPGRALVEDGVAPDVMGLFVGDDCAHDGDPIPAEIFLFLENIRDEAEGDETRYREEVRKTLLHEIGHFLGLNEEELWDRELD